MNTFEDISESKFICGILFIVFSILSVLSIIATINAPDVVNKFTGVLLSGLLMLCAVALSSLSGVGRVIDDFVFKMLGIRGK